ncbi:MAG: hypothetical protein ACKOT0_03260 [bacterium]
MLSRRMRAASVIAVVASMAVAQSPVAGTLASEGTPVPPAAVPPMTVAQACTVAERPLKDHVVDLSRLEDAGAVTISGETFAVGPGGWRGFVPAHPSTSQVFHSSAWLIGLYAVRPSQAVELLLGQAQASPDPGAIAGRDALVRGGWSESQVTLRTWTALCLHGLSGDGRIVPIINALVKANLDEARYYGPPLRAPHNHGVFANEALRAVGLLLGRPGLVARAAERLRVMFDEVFEPCGMMHEQASYYQVVNIRLWSRNLADDTSEAVQGAMSRARAALAALARPDGVLDPIGDGIAGIWDRERLAALGVSPGGEVFCPDTGWAAAHRALPDGRAQHHVARFGPKPRLHGHDDHGSITWWLGQGEEGISVLADRGHFDKRHDARRAWADSPAAHSVLRLVGGEAVGPTSGVRVQTPEGDSYRLITASPAGTAHRVLTMSAGDSVLGASDSFVSATGSRVSAVQGWQLGPEWERARRHSAQSADGAYTLTAFCHSEGKAWRAQVKGTRHFPGYRRTVPALELRCWPPRASRISIETIIVVGRGIPRARSVDGHLQVTTSTSSYTFTADGVMVEAPPEPRHGAR